MLKKTVISTALALVMGASAIAPASAFTHAPAMPEARTGQESLKLDVRHRRGGFYRDRNRAYYNGHRGYRHYRPGYRRYNDFWFPALAFALGSAAIIGSQPGYAVRPGRSSPAHIGWCYDRYRSYREWDNSFQPYNGPRRTCVSPYY